MLIGSTLWATFLAFARMGALAMTLPGLGEGFIDARTRLTVALLIAIAAAPAAAASAPPIPASLWAVIGLIISEILIGLIIGSVARMWMSALAIAGQTIALQSGLAFAQQVDPNLGEMGTTVQTFLVLVGLGLALQFNLHHAFIQAGWASYERFPIGGEIFWADAAELAVSSLGDAFRIGLQIAAPALAVGFLFYAALGVINRLIPNLQVFFLAMPAGILLTLGALALSLSAAMFVWLDAFAGAVMEWR